MPARPIRVAVVGAGPASSYAARHLLSASNSEVSILDRLPLPGGLLRSGVAPDHHRTKEVVDAFGWTYDNPRTTLYLNVDVGSDVTHSDLLRHHDAVVYGVGARSERFLDVPGEDTPGVIGSPTFVRWYNGDPDVAADAIDPAWFARERVVVVGNGNVALDIARILLTDPDRLAATDIADHALEVLRGSRVREVVLLGRRGPAEAAFTRPELIMLPDAAADVVVARSAMADRQMTEAIGQAAVLGELPRIDLDLEQPPAPGRRMVFAFHAQVAGAAGPDSLETVTVGFGDGRPDAVVPAGMLVRSTGHRGTPIADLPFDDATATVPHEAGRVIDPATGAPVPGAYVVGWIKRGASGGIGANRTCARETVTTLLADAEAGRLVPPERSQRSFGRLVSARRPDVVGLRQMRAIDASEVAAGQAVGRPRVKHTTRDDLLAAASRRR